MKSCRNCEHLFINQDGYYDCLEADRNDKNEAMLSLCFSWEPRKSPKIIEDK
jgi:hypothetical protein